MLVPKYEESRKNMVSCQLETGGVDNEGILNVFRAIPREEFLPASLKSLAYVDEDIRFSDRGFLIEPLVLARMIQAASPRPNDIVLNIGDVSGYSSALLSELVMTIVALEGEKGWFDEARKVWAGRDLCNIAVIPGKTGDGCEKHAPYSLILLNGAVETIPQSLLDQLSVGGRLVAVEKEKGKSFGIIVLVRRDSEHAFSRQNLYDAAVPYLDDAAPSSSEFVF